jgi:hypothetical protein
MSGVRRQGPRSGLRQPLTARGCNPPLARGIVTAGRDFRLGLLRELKPGPQGRAQARHFPQADFFDLAAFFAGAFARLTEEGAGLPFWHEIDDVIGRGFLGGRDREALLLFR